MAPLWSRFFAGSACCAVVFEADHSGLVHKEMSLAGVDEDGVGVDHVTLLRPGGPVGELVPALDACGCQLTIQRDKAL